jgi:hypothetical protein
VIIPDQVPDQGWQEDWVKGSDLGSEAQEDGWYFSASAETHASCVTLPTTHCRERRVPLELGSMC